MQYDKINWENQEKTRINSYLNNYIIKEILSKKNGTDIKIFDIGFGIGFFFKMLCLNLPKKFKRILLEGCEPSLKNYKFFLKKRPLKEEKLIEIKTYRSTFLDTKTPLKFDFITSVYVFPHFMVDDLVKAAKKIHSMIDKNGKFILVVANEKYLKNKLKTQKDLFIEKNIITYKGKKYEEILHYSDIPSIGKLIDYNREEQFYLDLFKHNKFKLVSKKKLNDNGFICSLFIFQKNK